MAGETKGLVPPTMATRARPSASSAACSSGVRGTTTMVVRRGPRTGSGPPPRQANAALLGIGGGGGGSWRREGGAQQCGTKVARPVDVECLDTVSSASTQARRRPPTGPESAPPRGAVYAGERGLLDGTPRRGCGQA